MILTQYIQKQERILDRQLTLKELTETMYSLLEAQEALGLLSRDRANEIIDDYLEYRSSI